MKNASPKREVDEIHLQVFLYEINIASPNKSPFNLFQSTQLSKLK
jgi:hypothetical protein